MKPKTQVWIVNQAPYKIGIKKGTTIGQVTSDAEIESQMEHIAIIQKLMTENTSTRGRERRNNSGQKKTRLTTITEPANGAVHKNHGFIC